VSNISNSSNFIWSIASNSLQWQHRHDSSKQQQAAASRGHEGTAAALAHLSAAQDRIAN